MRLAEWISSWWIAVTQAPASLLHHQLRGQQHSGCGTNPARPASLNLKSAEVGKPWRGKTWVTSLGRPAGSVEVLTKSLAFTLNRKEELEIAWHGLAIPLVLFSWFYCKRSTPKPQGGSGGSLKDETKEVTKGAEQVIGASAFLRGRAGRAAGAPFTNPGELFAQCPPFVPRTFLKLFLGLSSAWLCLVQLFQRPRHEQMRYPNTPSPRTQGRAAGGTRTAGRSWRHLLFTAITFGQAHRKPD